MNPSASIVRIEGIFFCTEASGEMTSTASATLVAGVGLEGDRYADRQGTFSALVEPGRQLTMVSADGVEAAFSSSSSSSSSLLATLGSIGNLRRNVVLRGISSDNLLNAIGFVVQFGPTSSDGPQLFLHRNCVPCMYNERRNQIPGLMDTLWETGGVSCEVIRGGQIRVGDSVTILPHEESEIAKQGRVPDKGGKSPEFFVRPKLRSAEMVKEMVEGKKRTKKNLEETDIEGLTRLQKSYQSVGLQF